jgi:hypothetical protein
MNREQQIIEERIQLIIEKIKLNRMLGYEKFLIGDDLKKVLAGIRKYMD